MKYITIEKLKILKYIFLFCLISNNLLYAYDKYQMTKDFSLSFQKMLPLQLTPNLSITRVFAIKDTLNIVAATSLNLNSYEEQQKLGNEMVINNYKKLKNLAKVQMLKTNCLKTDTRELLYLGMKQNIQYISNDKFPLFSFILEEKDCVKNSFNPKEKMLSKPFLFQLKEFNLNVVEKVLSMSDNDNRRFVYGLKNSIISEALKNMKKIKNRKERDLLLDNLTMSILLLEKLAKEDKVKQQYKELYENYLDIKFDVIDTKKLIEEETKINENLRKFKKDISDEQFFKIYGKDMYYTYNLIEKISRESNKNKY
ncbi:hypothetical protein [Poseidonibacter ostreae]|jgi:hypothetical protein|uniref:Uncharacterized protein n=1 Tax=Poseidonibacter ostreae TaxID=2654171 RepID=A0A6L4WS61_9BACT|nr:hypothetical protein [Poseidonibacter ostreae]KAB7887142.1 hypothetical protein GA417_03700 [Poseidonibacter ostreae]KAB7888648.1 hypothetical protein GBG19_08540 [Poseidonibacter ostreae]KAB7892305.1 hypothetical protein GBG18_03380 [Poseidonibacter ostreae]